MYVCIGPVKTNASKSYTEAIDVVPNDSTLDQIGQVYDTVNIMILGTNFFFTLVGVVI